MKTSIAAVLVATLVLTGCGTRLNPLNWFGPSEETLAAAPESFTADPRPLVAEVTSLSIERTVGGAIIRATGLPPTQGYWDVELVPVNDGDLDENRTLSFEFRAEGPIYPFPASTPQSRELVVAEFISDRELQALRRVTVLAAGNTRSVNRR